MSPEGRDTEDGEEALFLRGCLGFRSEGERDELWDGLVPDFGSRATGR